MNEVPTFRADQMPYGGVRDSGNTREGPHYAVREMTETAPRRPRMSDGRPPELLPPREPHPLTTHIAVDIGVVFLATLVVGLILGVSFLVIVGDRDHRGRVPRAVHPPHRGAAARRAARGTGGADHDEPSTGPAPASP